jgi:tetratricopeptide (TPR) repeat protein
MRHEVEWAQLSLDEKIARRRGLPARIPVPKGELVGTAAEGLSIDLCRKWAKDFLLNSEVGRSTVWRKKNAAMVTSLEAFVDKDPLSNKVRQAFAENDYARAIRMLKRIAAMDPDDDAARLDLAIALLKTSDYAAALKAFKAIRRTFEGDPEYHVSLGQVHLALNDKDSAAWVSG